MVRQRASKGFLVTPVANENIPSDRRKKWLKDAEEKFVSPSNSNKEYYMVILEALWPEKHGIPGPILTQEKIRESIDEYREKKGKGPYKDVFRRVRELQGEEGFTSIIKEGNKYQLQSLNLSEKREPRSKPSNSSWKQIKEKLDFRCAHCGMQEPVVQLSPDHRVPRSRGGTNDDENWQALCNQCNIIKSSCCQGCELNCYTCTWAYPENYKQIIINDENKEQIKRMSEKKGIDQSSLVNSILNEYFNSKR